MDERVSEYHDGVLYGIRHPGPSQEGCPFCASTLAQRDMIARWLGPTQEPEPDPMTAIDMSIKADTAWLAALIAEVRDLFPRSEDDMPSEEIATLILASDWLAARDARVRAEALARLTAIRDRLAMGDPLQTTVAEYITDALTATAPGQE